MFQQFNISRKTFGIYQAMMFNITNNVSNSQTPGYKQVRVELGTLFPELLNDAEKEAVRRGIAIDKSGNSAKLIDVAVSQGEVKVAPYLAKIIGYDRLRKINNRGKPEVAERQREASSGGFI